MIIGVCCCTDLEVNGWAILKTGNDRGDNIKYYVVHVLAAATNKTVAVNYSR